MTVIKKIIAATTAVVYNEESIFFLGKHLKA